MTTDVLLVLTTLPDGDIAARVARTLVEARHAACVNIGPAIRSVYAWQGAVEEADEVPLAIKTTRAAWPALERALRALHPYELPEIIALPVTHGLPAYLQWVGDMTDSS
ncbi:divalent-cation tolerance protein CutA [Methyloversatilis thermotolerans]|uniref:divalent-cation tolerance protein CutA n=1 Tax=Methyloversatilis thermotolerans TaxID=1346290 RepID=UPI00037B25DE|nr:divalent-cation tolerance protein CutA [Methyloversatilis thermotolerans]